MRGKQKNGKDYRDLFSKIRATNGIFHAKVGTIKDKNVKHLSKAEKEVARIHRTVHKTS